MLAMEMVSVIRHKVKNEGKSIRSVQRETGVSRNTVRKYLSVSEPLRVEKGSRPRPVLEGVAPRIEELLEEWKPRTTEKQRVTGTRLHRELVEGGYQVGITTVREYLREKKRQAAEVFIPLIHRPGEEAQVDFFEVTVDVGAERKKVWKFVLRLMYSGRDFAWLYDRCDQVSFLDAHVRAFAHCVAVPRRCVYDNLTSAVKRVTMPKRELSERFQALVSHYAFEPCFARPGEGHDKGGVEGRGKGIRLQHLVPIPRGESLFELSEALLCELDRAAETKKNKEGRSVMERFAEEGERMLALPKYPFDPSRVVPVSISGKSRVHVEGAWYSVPSAWASLEATAYVGVEEVRIICRGEEMVHEKQPFGGKSVRYRHYLAELSRKPQAVRQVAPELVAELGAPFDRFWKLLEKTHGALGAARIFAKVLAAVLDHGEEEVAAALVPTLDAERADLLGLSALMQEPRVETVTVPERLSGYEIESARASDFDLLFCGIESAEGSAGGHHPSGTTVMNDLGEKGTINTPIFEEVLS